MTRDSIFLAEISGDAGLHHAQDVAALLKAALSGHNKIVAATSAVTTADITTVQLLLATRRQALAAGKSFTLAAPPQGALRDLLIQIGIFDAAGTSATSDADFWLHEPQKIKGKAA